MGKIKGLFEYAKKRLGEEEKRRDRDLKGEAERMKGFFKRKRKKK